MEPLRKQSWIYITILKERTGDIVGKDGARAKLNPAEAAPDPAALSLMTGPRRPVSPAASHTYLPSVTLLPAHSSL